MLARRPYSAAELESRLIAAGYDEAAVSGALERLRHHRLIDDEAFAEQWVEQRRHKRAPAALADELERKGVVSETVAVAVDAVDEGAEAEAQAKALLGKVERKPPARRAPALYAMLVRRGFSSEVAEAAARRVLPPEGWD
jgi:regulatory protein